MLKAFASVLLHVPQSLHGADDDPHSRRLFLGINLFGTLALAFLAIFFASSGEYVAAEINGAYAVLSAAIYFLLRLNGRHYRVFLYTQIFVVQVNATLTTLALGGFAASGYFFAWALISPLAAIVFTPLEKVWRWFAFYLVMLAVMLVAQPADHHNHIPAASLLLLSFVNLGGASAQVTLMLYHATRQLRLEQAKSEGLLLNILPKDITAMLKKEAGVIADYFPGVTILFADVVDFTPMSANMHPVELVKLLNEAFSHFDALVEKYGLEKIKTIGDCYMVASGVPRSRADHAQAMVKLALDMRAFAETHTFENGRKLNFRIGVNSGPVVAGVIGRKKFIYDLWGDAVNVASRMESHGRSGAVQITDDTWQLIRDEFICEPGGTIQVKGKGEMKVWHVTQERAA